MAVLSLHLMLNLTVAMEGKIFSGAEFTKKKCVALRFYRPCICYVSVALWMRGSAITIPMLSNSYTKLEEEKKQLY
jgi:hypothetical protein